MTRAMLDIDWEPSLLQPGRDPEVEQYARKIIGRVPASVQHFLPCRWLARAYVELNFTSGLLVHLELPLASLVAMEVSRENSCRYCYAVSRFYLRMQGMDEQRVRDIEQQLAEGHSNPRIQAALDFTRRMSRSDPLVNESDRHKLLEAGFSPEALRDLAYVVAYMTFANRAATIVAVPPYSLEQMPDRWWMRLLRPLLARTLRRGRAGTAEPAQEPPDSVPYSHVARAYGGLPIARVLSATLRGAWTSPVLTRRCKALLFLVVAHGLGCAVSEREARKVLAQESIAEHELDEILRHLRSPRLTPEESVLVPFARETLWYEPVKIQRRARAVKDALTPDQFREAVGVLALANAVCRLGAAVVDRPG